MEVEACIRQNLVWGKLPDELRLMLGNSPREYDKQVLDYSIKNQLRYKGNIVRFVKKSEEMYYDNLIRYSQAHLMLYPYHLADIAVRELRLTPFNYYLQMVMDLMSAEKSYDSLPNFAAADVVRLLGIGRNQYIELMNQMRSMRKLFRRSKPLRDLLPPKPIPVPVEPWYLVCAGSILETDIKALNKGEKDVIDILLDEGPQLAGTLDAGVVQNLYARGLTYFDVPVKDQDYIFVPPLDGFVMNRVLGDYFETLLYKIFVALDEQTSVAELSEMLDIDLQLVKNAVSVFCRLGIAKKRITGLENMALHVTWAKYMKFLEEDTPSSPMPTASALTTITTDLGDLSTSLVSPAGDDDEDETAIEITPSPSGQISATSPGQLLATPAGTGGDSTKRIAFLFDSSLTAFLMMGNLSTSLKNHAVTMFEVGKLSDEALNSFVEELQMVNTFAEGEAQRYSEHARTLLQTIVVLREYRELDLIRGESLHSLDATARVRLVQKNYELMVSMAPLSCEACPSPFTTPPHFGPPVAEVCSPWFRLHLYELVGTGPVSLLLPKGVRVCRVPRAFRDARRLLLSTFAHEPGVVAADNCLLLLNDTLQSSPVFLQEYSEIVDDTEIVNVPFPFSEEAASDGDPGKESFADHPSVVLLREKLSLDVLCGYIVLLKMRRGRGGMKRKEKPGNDAQIEKEKLDDGLTDDTLDLDDVVAGGGRTMNGGLSAITSPTTITKDPRKVSSSRSYLSPDESYSDFVLFDCVFGIPLFDEHLNRVVCRRICEARLFESQKWPQVQFANHNLAAIAVDVVHRFQLDLAASFECERDANPLPLPVQPLLFDATNRAVVPIRL